MAIDVPLGWPDALKRPWNSGKLLALYLYIFLFDLGLLLFYAGKRFVRWMRVKYT